MLKAIGNALAGGVAAVFSAMAGATKWGFQVARGFIRLPFDLLGGQPMPASYEPEVQQSDILEELLESRKRAAAVHTLDRDGIATVMQFCSTHRDDRPSFLLPKDLSPDVKVALRTMDDKALMALKKSGIGKVRKFIDGKEHGIVGVPAISKTSASVVEEQPPAGLTEHQRILWKVESKLRKAKESTAFDFEQRAVCKP